MKNKYLVRIISVLFSIMCLFVAWVEPLSAEKRIRIYKGDKQEYTGYIEKQHDGSYREYSKTGEFKARIDSQGIYTKNGSFTRYSNFLKIQK